MDTALLRSLLVVVAALVQRDHARAITHLLAENHVLRQHLPKKRLRLTDPQRRRLARAGHHLGRARLREFASLASPDTILRWYRHLVARKYTALHKRRPGRPKTPLELEALVVRLARDNPSWGYTRSQAALQNLGHRISRSTVARILARHGLDPSPGRPSSWKSFLAAHWPAISAADFFVVELLTLRGIVRVHVFFVLELATRRVRIAGICRNPDSTWLSHVVRGLCDEVDGFLRNARFLILDRDPLFSADLRQQLRHAGIEVVRTPPRSPNLNAYAERFIGSVRRECLDKVIPLGERHLRWLLREYAAHYHAERNHQGLGNRILEPDVAANAAGPIHHRTRLGGLLSFYHREVA